ncbi:hypothetical protein [Alicyclobacillus kakegawensis]|uniref:hypothetical protein n=1 Tax=Alicyclobacillus kakegawensis TaxID=392012 RepID=UPI00082C9726|nr:hypothetical protein [Alicyclobacillus kakegawensis]
MRILLRIEALAKQPSKTVIMSTHSLHELQFVDCVMYLLHEGKLRFRGSYKEFLLVGQTDNPDIAFQRLINEEVRHRD